MSKTKKKIEMPRTHEQWLEIETKDGKTVVTRYPSNAEFEKLRLEMDPQPELIYRRMNFVGSVPPEYSWTKPTPDIRELGGLFLQRMDVDNWCQVYANEMVNANGAIVSAKECLPRPEAFGPCPCHRCTAEREAESAAEPELL